MTATTDTNASFLGRSWVGVLIHNQNLATTSPQHSNSPLSTSICLFRRFFSLVQVKFKNSGGQNNIGKIIGLSGVSLFQLGFGYYYNSIRWAPLHVEIQSLLNWCTITSLSHHWLGQYLWIHSFSRTGKARGMLRFCYFGNLLLREDHGAIFQADSTHLFRKGLLSVSLAPNVILQVLRVASAFKTPKCRH